MLEKTLESPLDYKEIQPVKFMLTESVMPSNHLIFCHPLLLLPSIFSSIRIFSNGSVLHIRWPQYWSFSFSISPSDEYSAISFRTDWLDLLIVQGTLKSLLQHVVSCYYIEAVQFYKNHISNPKHLDKERLFSKASSWVRKTAPCLGVRKEFTSGTSLLVQCLRLHFQCRGHYFSPWSGD